MFGIDLNSALERSDPLLGPNQPFGNCLELQAIMRALGWLTSPANPNQPSRGLALPRARSLQRD